MKLEQYVDHLLSGDDEICLAEGRDRARDLEGLHNLYVELITPSQYRIGELWEGGKISIAAEHLATVTNSYVAGACYSPLVRATTGGPRALITCSPDELHALGPRLLADLLECDGWDVNFYGTSMPVPDLIGAIREHKPRFIGLSVALVMHLESTKRSITAIRAALGAETPAIVVGGNAFRGSTDLWSRVGADLYAADASAAVEMLHGLQTPGAASA